MKKNIGNDAVYLLKLNTSEEMKYIVCDSKYDRNSYIREYGSEAFIDDSEISVYDMLVYDDYQSGRNIPFGDSNADMVFILQSVMGYMTEYQDIDEAIGRLDLRVGNDYFGYKFNDPDHCIDNAIYRINSWIKSIFENDDKEVIQ